MQFGQRQLWIALAVVVRAGPPFVALLRLVARLGLTSALKLVLWHAPLALLVVYILHSLAAVVPFVVAVQHLVELLEAALS